MHPTKTRSSTGRVINPLKEWGRLIGVGDPEPATQAELVVSLPVTAQTGNLPSGSQFLFGPSGVLYLSMVAVQLNAAMVQVRIKAASDQSGGDGSVASAICKSAIRSTSPTRCRTCSMRPRF
jgi:hypothetical protein